MAEGFLNKLCGDKYKAESAWVTPTQINPYVVKVMAEIGIDLSRHRLKSIMEFQTKTINCVVTVCDSAREICPFFPRKKEIHKSIPDPAAFERAEEKVLSKVRLVRIGIKDWVVKSFCKGNDSEASRFEHF
jgi:arsenate reductase